MAKNATKHIFPEQQNSKRTGLKHKVSNELKINEVHRLKKGKIQTMVHLYLEHCG